MRLPDERDIGRRGSIQSITEFQTLKCSLTTKCIESNGYCSGCSYSRENLVNFILEEDIQVKVG